MPEPCPYCSVTPEDTWIASELAVAVLHPQPLAQFHFIVVPKRHVMTFYELDVQEQGAIWVIIREIEKRLAETMQLAGVDIGFQDGQSAEEHAHVHVLPKIPGRRVELPPEAEWVAG